MALASMEGLILLALVVFAALSIAVMTIARGNWWNVATFTFATTTWTWILVRALRSRRSVG